MDIQYYHSKTSNKRYTLALEVPSKNKLLDLLKLDGPKEIELLLGKAKVHPNDNYNHKVGREVSNSKMKRVKGKLVSFYSDVEKESIILSIKLENEFVDLKIHNKSTRPWFIYSYNTEL